jgi:regulator of protease activity HflC (stomatin/prohibitin superfamily)
MTKDNLTICMDGAVYYEIFDVAKAKYRVNNIEKGV